MDSCTDKTTRRRAFRFLDWTDERCIENHSRINFAETKASIQHATNPGRLQLTFESSAYNSNGLMYIARHDQGTNSQGVSESHLTKEKRKGSFLPVRSAGPRKVQATCRRAAGPVVSAEWRWSTWAYCRSPCRARSDRQRDCAGAAQGTAAASSGAAVGKAVVILASPVAASSPARVASAATRPLCRWGAEGCAHTPSDPCTLGTPCFLAGVHHDTGLVGTVRLAGRARQGIGGPLCHRVPRGRSCTRGSHSSRLRDRRTDTGGAAGLAADNRAALSSCCSTGGGSESSPVPRAGADARDCTRPP